MLRSPAPGPRRRPFPVAWTVALWCIGGTALFVVLAWWLIPTSPGMMATEFGRRVLHLGAAVGWDYLLVLLLVFAVEVLVLGWHDSSAGRLVRASRSARTDLILAGLHTLGWAPLTMTLFSVGWIWAIERLAKHYVAFDLLDRVGPVWVQFLVVLVVTDLLDYWSHRLCHDIDFLWETHQYHHAATEFTVLTGTREHALFEAFQRLVAYIPLAAMGTSLQQYIGARVVLLAIEFLQHSMVPWTYGWFGRWLVFSPIGHRIHHSPRADQHTSNYGNLLVIWDRLFGTWYGGSDVNTVVGLPHTPYNRQSVVVEYLHTVARTVRTFRHSLRTGRWRTGPGTATK